MREGQNASAVVVWVRDGLKAKVGELGRNFSSTFRGFGFDDESVRAPAHDGDIASTAKFAGGIEPRRILGAREERHRESIPSPRLKGATRPRASRSVALTLEQPCRARLACPRRARRRACCRWAQPGLPACPARTSRVASLDRPRFRRVRWRQQRPPAIYLWRRAAAGRHWPRWRSTCAP